jgi:hypothetical protein
MCALVTLAQAYDVQNTNKVWAVIGSCSKINMTKKRKPVEIHRVHIKVRFEVLTVVKMMMIMMMFFWVVTPCVLVGGY